MSPRRSGPESTGPLFPKPSARAGRPESVLRPTGRRAMDRVVIGVVALFAVGWTYTIAQAATGDGRGVAASSLTANPFSADAPPEAAFVMDALVRTFATPAVRGESGEVDVLIEEPGAPLALPSPPELAEGAALEYRPVRDGAVALDAPGLPADSAGSLHAPSEPGTWALVAVADGDVREIPGVRVITQVPLSLRREGRIGSYLIGEWPFEEGGAQEGYEAPTGIIEVTPENVTLPVSEHFVLGDFLTKGQADVWPKYVLLSPRLLDKAELTIQQLETMGHPVENVGVISGFRTPSYNAHGGDTSGRGSLSRHMYGDALDFYIDNDNDGRMDDLNGDGQVTVADAGVIGEAAEAVEQAHPGLIGGIGIYTPTGAHSGFVHVDTRGYRARW